MCHQPPATGENCQSIAMLQDRIKFGMLAVDEKDAQLHLLAGYGQAIKTSPMVVPSATSISLLLNLPSRR